MKVRKLSCESAYEERLARKVCKYLNYYDVDVKVAFGDHTVEWTFPDHIDDSAIDELLILMAREWEREALVAREKAWQSIKEYLSERPSLLFEKPPHGGKEVKV